MNTPIIYLPKDVRDINRIYEVKELNNLTNQVKNLPEHYSIRSKMSVLFSNPLLLDLNECEAIRENIEILEEGKIQTVIKVIIN